MAVPKMAGHTPGGSAVIARKKRRNSPPEFTLTQILAWIDEWHARTGAWPKRISGPIPGTCENWRAVDNAIRYGLRGMKGGSSIARLLAEMRGVRNFRELPPFTEAQILAWADAHFRRKGTWPTRETGPVTEAPGETWYAINSALASGRRGLQGGGSLAALLRDRRGVPISHHPPPLTMAIILRWVKAHRAQTGRRPVRTSGAIPGAAGETWANVDQALRKGLRGLPAGGSLAKLLKGGR
jgi:hypothetical protein